MQHLLIEDLDLVRLVAKKDSSHLLSGLYIVLELVGSQLSLQISKYILNGRELRSVRWVVKHLEPVLLYHLHYLRVLMSVKVIVLKDQRHIWIHSFHLLHQVTEVFKVRLVGLASFLKELNLLTAMSGYTNGAGHVAGQKLLPPLQKVS